MPDQFDAYRAEMNARKEGFVPSLDRPSFDEHRQSTGVGEASGFWRAWGARTKPNLPLMIVVDDSGQRWRQWGNGKREVFDGDRWKSFLASTWLRCGAVSKAEWQAALDTGLWPDDWLAADAPSPEQKHGAAATMGENMAGADDDEARDAYAKEINEKLEPLVTEARSIVVIDQSTAERLALLRDQIREIGGVGEKTRKAQKEPVNKLAVVIEGRWLFLKEASEIALNALDRIDGWKRAEQRKAEEAARKKRAEEAEAARKVEEDRLRKEAEQHGMDVDEGEIARQAEEKAAEVASAPVEPVAAPVVRGSATARAATKARVKTGNIIDAKVFAGFLIDQGDEELMAALQRRANAAARAGIKMQGMEID